MTPIPSAQRPSDPGYQPVSGYAVAAAVVAGLFAVFLIAVVVSAITSRRTPFSYELLVLPAVGVVLAAIGRSHVRNSEGTRTGMRMANGAWWACVLGGVGFAGYMYANELVLERESGRYAAKFFDELKAGRPTHAFLYMLPPEERDRADPATPEVFEVTYAMAGFGNFKNHELVRLVVRNGSAVELEQTGVKDVSQESAGFQATHLYRLTCPEGVFDVQVKLVAPESRKTKRPEWYIPSQPAPNFTLQVNRLSRYGRLVSELEQEGDGAAKLWMSHMSGGRLTLGQLMTTPKAHRDPLEAALFNARFLGGGTAVHVPMGPGFLPADRAARWPAQSPATLAGQSRATFDDLAGIGFFRRDQAGGELAADRMAKMRDLWAPPRLSAVSVSRQLGVSQVPPDLPQTSFSPDGMTVSVAAELTFESNQHYARCVVGVTCRSPEVLAVLDEARKRGADDTGEVSMRTLPPRDWQVAWLRTDMETHSVITGPGSMNAPGP